MLSPGPALPARVPKHDPDQAPPCNPTLRGP
jgi:hypothetical protein